MSKLRSFGILGETDRGNEVFTDDVRGRPRHSTGDSRSSSLIAAGKPRQVGRTLKQAREARRLRLSDISDQLRIRQDYLEAIEDGRLGHLPGPPYTAGFIRSYAKYLGVDPKALLENLNTFEAASVKAVSKPVLLPNQSLLGTNKLLLAVPLLIVAGILAIWAVIYPAGDREGNVQSAPATDVLASVEVPPAIPIPETVSETAAATPAPGPVTRAATSRTDSPTRTSPGSAFAATLSPFEERLARGEPGVIYGSDIGATRIVLWANDDSWVEITDRKGNIIFARLLAAGDRYYVDGRTDLTLTTGNAGGLEIYIDGVSIPAIGPAGKVRRGIALDREQLRETETR